MLVQCFILADMFIIWKTLLLSLVCIQINFSTASRLMFERSDSNTNRYRHSVFLSVVTKDDNEYECGGTLIDPRWILTTAFCVFNKLYIDALLGANYLGESITIRSRKFFHHPQFNNDNFDYDLGLVKIPYNVNIVPWNQPNENIKLRNIRYPAPYWHGNIFARRNLDEFWNHSYNNIQLRRQRYPAYWRRKVFTKKNSRNGFLKTVRIMSRRQTSKSFDSSYAEVPGWIQNVNATMNPLFNTNLRVITNRICSRYYEPQYVTKYTMCAVLKEKYNEDLKCFGDSGHGLFVKDTDGELTQIGIASFVSTEKCHATPAGFVRLNHFLQWISESTGLQIMDSN